MAKYKGRKVTLEETDNEDYTKKARGEWQIVHLATDAVVMRIPWSSFEDASEYPERYFHDGPESISIDEDAHQVVLYQNGNETRQDLPPEPS